jgi:hypothetical protein
MQGKNHDVKEADRLFENVSQFIYLETTVRNENLIQEGIERRLNSSNAACTVQPRSFFILMCFLKR